MIVRLFVQSFVWFGGMGVVMFLAAGTVDWPGAWAFLGEMAGLGVVAGLALNRHDPALLNERLRPLAQKDQPVTDRVLMIVIILLIFGWLAFMGLDAVRFRWSVVPVWGQVLGGLCIALSTGVGYRVMRENSFAAPVVKIQKERGQTVISTGPYRHIRHPMYAGGIFFFIGTPLLMGSGWGLAVAPFLFGVLIIRIFIEEKALREGLPGYDAYAARVRYRLIPHIW
ncbi:MAG TPA: isoprenylcysteine carboxylmethyltransferase family protein [Patescibacteria group bacterium]|nr:isoprenylcysteine carboxylmethyltransferase family protein [Patescibacteria group bacterium]